MKGIQIVVIGLVLQSAANFAGAGTLNEPAHHPLLVTELPPTINVTASLLYLRPESANLGWGVVTTVLPIPNPQWQVQTIKPDFHLGFHLGAQYPFSPSLGDDVQLNWFVLHGKDERSVHVNPATQWISPFSQTGTPPTGGEITGIASLKSGYAQVKFDYNNINVDLGKSLTLGEDWQTRLFLGLSGASIKEKLSSNFNGSPQAVFSLFNKSTYAGAGPRIGIENQFAINQHVNFRGLFAGALLLGKMRPAQYQFNGYSSYLQLIGVGTGNREAVGSPNTTHTVAAGDLSLAINYHHFYPALNKSMVLELGYMATIYANPLSAYETNTNVIALDSGSLSTSSVKHLESNFLLAGPYLRACYSFA